jgi:hypothetical protein
MERVYHLNALPAEEGNNPSNALVQLAKQHLLIKAELAEQLIGSERQVFAVYYKDKQSLLIAPESEESFKKMHKTIMLFVKVKNLAGDRSISLQEFFADWPDLDSTDRDLTFDFNHLLKILNVAL